MKGKRTYLTLAAAAVYLIGGRLHIWPLDRDLLTALGLAAAAFLRAAIEGRDQRSEVRDQPEAPRPSARLPLPLISALCLLTSLSLLTGCTVVPKTSIRFNPTTHTIAIASPKEIEIKDLKLELLTNGVLNITIGSYSSHNNAAVIATIAQANQANLKLAVESGGALLGEAAKQFAK